MLKHTTRYIFNHSSGNQPFSRMHGPLLESNLPAGRRAFKRAERRHSQRRVVRDRLSEIRRMANEAIRQGKYETEVKSYLTKPEKKAINEIVFKGKTQSRQLTSVSHDRFAVYHVVDHLLRKLENWENGKPPIYPRYFRLRTSIVEIISKRRKKGETLAEIKRNAKLNVSQSKIVDCILQQLKMFAGDIAKRIKKSSYLVSAALRDTENKLLGKDPYEFEKRKYLGKSDAHLRKEIKLSGAKTRGELYQKNRALYLICRDRGILDSVFPLKKSEFLQHAEHEVRKQLRKNH